MPNDNSKIIDRVRKLLALAERAGTPEEAGTAYATAQKLIAQHALSDEQVRIARLRETGGPIDEPIVSRIVHMTQTPQMPTWLGVLGQCLADATISLSGGAWSMATAAQINADLVTILNTIPNAAQGAIGAGGLTDYRKVKIMLPQLQYQRAANLIVSAASNKSVLKYFMDNNGLRDDQVVQVYDFQASNSAMGLSAGRGVVMYEVGDNWDPKFMLPQPKMPSPPRQNGLSEMTFYHARAGGLMVADARRIRYIEGF